MLRRFWRQRADEGEVLSLLAFAGSAIQLVPDGTLVFHLVLIIVMVSFLNLWLLKPINRVLDERARRTKGRLGEAETILRSVDVKMREYEQRLQEARARGYALLEDQRGAASQERARRVASVKAEVSDWRDQERDNLNKEEADTQVTLMRDARARAAEIGGRILGRKVPPPAE